VRQLSRAIGWLLRAEGSTRPAALLRIGICILLISRWAHRNAWHNLDDDPLLLATGIAYSVFAVLGLVGFKTRFSMAMLAIAVSTLHLYFGHELGAWHYTKAVGPFQVVVIVAMMPCGRSFSADRWLALRRADNGGPPPPEEWGPLWASRLLCCQVSLLYFWAIYDKIDPGWFDGSRLAALWMHYYGSSDDLVLHGGALESGSMVAGTGTLLVEAYLLFGLWFARTRKTAVLLGLALHFSFLTFLGVWPLSARMPLCYLAFANPATIHRFFDLLVSGSKNASAPAGEGV
jgi:hypothetical protein